MKFFVKNSKAYTLVEVLVATTIFVSVVGIGVATYSSASGFQSKSEVLRETNQTARYAMDTIARDIRNADASVSYVAPNGKTYVYKGFVFTNSSYPLIDPISNAKYTSINIYRKGRGECSDYVEEVVYKLEEVTVGASSTNIPKLTQTIRYLQHSVSGDFNSPALYNVTPITECNTPSTVDILGGRVQLTNTVDSFFKGTMDFTEDGARLNEESANVTISLQAKPANSSEDPMENRIITLQSNVIPRNIWN